MFLCFMTTHTRLLARWNALPPEPHVDGFAFFRGITAKTLAVVTPQAPLGYEDELGFHFGVIRPQSEKTNETIPLSDRTPS
jgi:hypothetical protein